MILQIVPDWSKLALFRSVTTAHKSRIHRSGFYYFLLIIAREKNELADEDDIRNELRNHFHMKDAFEPYLKNGSDNAS